MLSRTADHLFWMGRYLERAEHLARLLDAHHRQSLLPRSAATLVTNWQATLDSLSQSAAYHHVHGEVRPDAVFHFLAFDREHPGSLVSCLQAARENARAVRGTITAETWEALNAAWLEARTLTSGTSPEAPMREGSAFLEFVKDRAHLVHGVITATMLRDEAHAFLRLGSYLERADGTVRLLGARWSDETNTADWAVVLRSLSAFEPYRRLYREAVSRDRVTELLLLQDTMPRSVHRSLNQVNDYLQAIARNGRSSGPGANAGAGNETLRRAGELHAQFHYARYADWAPQLGAPFFTALTRRLEDLGSRIAQDFLVPMSTGVEAA